MRPMPHLFDVGKVWGGAIVIARDGRRSFTIQYPCCGCIKDANLAYMHNIKQRSADPNYVISCKKCGYRQRMKNKSASKREPVEFKYGFEPATAWPIPRSLRSG